MIEPGPESELLDREELSTVEQWLAPAVGVLVLVVLLAAVGFLISGVFDQPGAAESDSLGAGPAANGTAATIAPVQDATPTTVETTRSTGVTTTVAATTSTERPATTAAVSTNQ
ncbi:AAA family ATPase, partial [Halobacteriales archaeon QH_9_66_26]